MKIKLNLTYILLTVFYTSYNANIVMIRFFLD